MKIVRAMKKVARLQGEIKELKKRITSCLSTIEENEFDEDYTELIELLNQKIKHLITLKARIMKTNTSHDMFSVILNLGELKSYIDFTREMNPKYGVIKDRFEDENATYKSQIKIIDKNKAVEKCQDLINKLTDELDDFNARTDLKELDVTVQLV